MNGHVLERRVAHRAALDHVLALIADAPWSTSLALRGSMSLPAWAGAAAREPADLDWVVLEDEVRVDALHPYPYVDTVDVVQQWPEAADGAARYEMWQYEEFGTDGRRPHLAPEGLHWVRADPQTADLSPPYMDLLDRVRMNPQAARGVLLVPDDADEDGTWTYAEYDTPGVRLVIPWHAEGLPPGEVRLDFARDELLPEAPVWTLIPRADGDPVAVRTASRELSLAWKLLWMHVDCATEGRAQGKDLYDAVLLAEAEGTALSQRLLRKVLCRAPVSAAGDLGADAMTRWQFDWDGFRAEHPSVRGSARDWLDRLVRALEPTLFRPGPARSSAAGRSSS
ncbi:nucleotidyl transferase AbiEii/AbiGii toxin family protein [Streptomyces griseus]|uniref:nucleotidyl transferase AbiEii/AbiGii toxin family protein n=1 Tax=Streptomyces griseus TaxID=1911 RepID=UPI00068C6C07|nr:nucleotidyl transferase AbiEii/AbiGii toxin family protein [Streptomyces griseus]